MSMRTLAVGFLALIAGTAAAIAANQFLRSWPKSVPVEAANVDIVVAREELHRGRTVRLEDLKTIPWPAALKPPGAIEEIARAEGRLALTTHFKDQPVLDAQLAPRSAHTGLAAIVPTGMRAFTIHIPTVATGVAGFVLPGNYVDVLLTINSGYSGGTCLTVTLLQRIEILAVDQELDVPDDNKVERLRSVTLLVTPEQAAKLSLAESRGTLQLALRNPEDISPASVVPISLADLQLLAEEPAPEVEPAPPSASELVAVKERPKPRSRFVQIRTLRGTHAGVVKVRIPKTEEGPVDVN